MKELSSFKGKSLEEDENKKVIALYPFKQRFHSIYNSTIELISKNYNLYYTPKISRLPRIKNNKFTQKYYYFFVRIVKKILNLLNIRKKYKLDATNILLFCSNKLPPTKFDFILDLEIITALSYYDYNELDRKYIYSRLASEKCKAIICWNKASYVSLIKTIDCSSFKHKIKIIPFARNRSKIKKENSKEKINFIFVSSINNTNDFETKGGLIALKAYSILTKKYKNIKFFVRSKVSKKIVDEYKNTPGLVFLTDELSDDKMKELFSSADILLEPIPGISLMLECMDYGIPAVSFNFWCIPEMIIDKKSGFLVNSSDIFKNINDTKNYMKTFNSKYKLLYDEKEYTSIIPKFVESAEKLISNPTLLKKMKKYQQKLIMGGGKYSLSKRNKQLIEVINSAIQ